MTAVRKARRAARAAGLTYVSARTAGIRRLGPPGAFRYLTPRGRPLRDRRLLERIRRLAIPPAYRDVWICARADGHLQAVGRDARGRKQYRYHERWREVRDEAKYDRLTTFGRVLPRIRRRVARDMRRKGLPREKVLAALVELLERTLVRIGNEEYARTNRSFGLTTLRTRHAHVRGQRLELDFRGKHGMRWHLDVRDGRLARLVRRLQDLPGQELFQYVDEAGVRHCVDSGDVNAYLREITGEDVTAKDFRTWAATNLAVVALQALEPFDSQARARRNVVATVERVAKVLGNTPAMCRRCYIHPAIFEGYLDGSLMHGLRRRAEAVLARRALGRPARPQLRPQELAVVAFLSRRLAKPGRRGVIRVSARARPSRGA